MATKKTPQELIEEKLSEYLKNANSFTEGAKTQFSGEGYRGNTKEYYDATSASVASSKQQEAVIRGMLSSYSRYLPEGYADSVTKYLDDFGGYENQILAAAKKDYEYFSRFADENAYLSALESERKEEAKKTVDWESLLSEVEKDQTYIDAAKEFKSHYEAMRGGLQTLINYYESLGYSKSQARVMAVSPDQDPVRNKMLGYLNTYGESKLLEDTTSLQDDVNTRRAYANSAKYIQLAPNMEATAKSDPYFEEYANDRPDMFEILKEGRYQGFTDDQIKVWNYYYNTDPKLADEYRYAIEESVNQKIGEKRFKELEDERFLEYLFAIEAGLDQFTTGFESLFSGADYIPASSTAFASSLVREDLKDTGATLPEWLGGGSVGQGAYDLITTTANMAPSILASFIPYVGQAASLTMLGASAAGHARAEAINLGYTNAEATTFGLLVGASEASLQYLLGGIGKMGGVGKNAVLNALGGVEKGFLKVASKIANSPIGKWVASMASEGLEEYLQTIIEPQIKNAILKENNEVILLDSEALYSGILGALSAGFLESGGLVGGTVDSISAAIDTRAVGKAVIDSGMTANIQEFVYNTFAADTVAYKIANKITDKTGAYKIGRLLNSVQANLSEQNKSDIQAALISKGVAEKDAKTITEALANVIGVKKLSEAEEALYEQGLESNDVIATVLREVIIDPNSSVNQRTSQFNTLTDDIQAAYLGNIVRSVGMKGISEEDAVNLKKEAEFYGIGADEFLASAQASNATPAHFSRAFKERYLQGKIGDKTVSKYVNSYLSETEQNTAYRLGEIAAKAERESAQKSEAAMPKKKVESGTGRVTVDSSVSAASREGAKTQIQAVEKIAEALGIRVRFYESVVSENGNRVLSTNKDTAAPNGWFDKDTDTVHLDIKAGKDGKGFVMFTLAHELTHFVAKRSKTQFNVLADFVTERYNKEGKDITRTIRNRMKNLAEQKIKSYMELTTEEARYEYAREEVIADSMETMLASGNVMRDLADLRTQSEGLFNKIRGFLKDFANKIRKLYQKISPETAEGKFIAESKDAVEELEKLFANALKVSAENYAAAGNVGVELDPTSESVSPSSVMSLRTWTASEYVQNRRQTAKILAKALDISEAKALRYIDTVNSVAKKIADDKVRLDYEASSFGSAFVSNVEYGGSFDYTTLCKKRRLYTGTFTEIQKRLKDAVLTPDEILEIRNLMIDAGYEATCGLCYVEGSRANMGKFAKEFIKLYKRDNPNSWTPTMADVNTPDGVEAMRINHPDTYDQYVYFWNHYGKLKDTDKALFASQQKPKLYEARKEYNGEILEHFAEDTSVEKKNKNGGIRMQSFSDFEIVHLIDTMQVIMDMSRVGLAGQAYTKVPEFAKAFGNTGLKINLSLIAKGVDSKGNLIFDDREGMPHETAFEIRNQYSKNVGTIIVTFTDEQLLAAMADDRIDFIIPFHRSQWKKGQYGAMGLPKGTKDYTFMQNEKLIKQTYHEYQGRMVKDKASNYMPNKYWDFTKSGKENAEDYLEMCAANNKRPKFYKLLAFDGKGKYSLKKDGSTDGYWKLLIDFKMYDNDGIGSPQMAVKPDFSMDEAMTMLDEYKGGHNTYPVAYDVVDRFVEKYEASPTPSDSAVMSIRNIVGDSGKHYGLGVYLDSTLFNNLTDDQRIEMLKARIEELGGNAFTAYDESGNPVNIRIAEKKEKFKNEKGKRVFVNQHLTNYNKDKTKQEAIALADEVILVARFDTNDPASKSHDWLDDNGKNAWDIWRTYLQDKENTVWEATLRVANSQNGEKVLYEIYPIKMVETVAKRNTITTTPTLPQTPSVVKTSDKNSSPSDNSMQSTRATTDSDGNALSAEQKKFFKDSKVRDENGNLLVMYHGTNADFTVFDRAKIGSNAGTADGYGFYFSSSDNATPENYRGLDHASTYGENVFKGYVNITSPLLITQKTITKEQYLNIARKLAEKHGIYGYPFRFSEMYDDSPSDYYLYSFINSRNAGYPVDIDDVINEFEKLGFDGVFYQVSKNTFHAVTFSSEQFKSIDNKTPTSDPDIRYQPRETREYTDRELLADALDSVATSEDDRKKLRQYKKKVADADELERTLSELRAKKKALEEAKAKRSEIRAVQDEITKTENRITIIDKQLFNLQATVSMKRVLESEKNRRAKQARAKHKASDDAKRKKAVSDAVKEAEDDYQKKLDAQKKHQAEIEARRKERASRTELRHKIIDKVKKLSDKLRNPSKDKHIPASLQKPVARFLSAISIDTFGADKMINRNLKKLEALLDKLEKATNDIDRSVLMDKIAELQKSIQWEEAIGVSIKEKASTMRSAYEALANDKDPRVQDGYDQVVADMLKEVVEVCGDTPLRYMTLEQLTTLNDAINAVNKRVSESNKAFSEGKKKTIEEYAEATARELPDTSKASVVKFVKAIKRFGWGLLKPATAMEIIGSQTFTELYENIQDGEETWMQNIAKAKAFFQEIATKHGYYSWDLQKTYDFVDTRGKTFTLTLGEMLSLYAYSRRPQAAKHLEEGGFKFDEKSDDRRKNLKDRKNDKENHKLNRDILKVIENKIGETEGALEFANELQAYLSKDMAALGNEISMSMYDYLAFGEENYFPIYSSKSYIDFNPDSQGNILLKNRSFTKSVVKNANNPIIVGDFVDIWTRHVNEMITYNAFALPVEDFMRTYNFKFKTADGSQDSIKDRIVKAYGEDAAKYVEQLLRDINGGVVADHSAEFSDALVTRFKKLKVMLSASVVIQQPSAMARAFAMIDPKYFRGIGVGNHKERWERVMKYAPIAMIKAMGRFDINLGQSAQDYLTAQEYNGTKEKAKAVFTDKNYRDEVLTRAPAYADEMAWITIFEACEREMAELRPDLEKGSEKFMQLVGRRFTEVIRATQVYDSVFSRSQIMRSKNVFTKMITAFMSEPMTTLNMAFRSMLEASRSGKKWYALPFNRTMVAVSTSIILNSLLVSLVYAMRDDDEDETYLESYLESFTTEVADGFNPLTYIPFVKDIWSLLQGYDVERTDMALWSDIIDKAYDFIKVFNTDTSEMSEEAYDKWLKDVWSQSASAVSEIISFATGIPITNVIRDASGAVDTTIDALTSDRENSWDTMFDAIAEGFKNTLPGSNLKPNNPAKYDPTYSDYTSYKPKDAFAQFDRGNTAKGKEIIDKLIKARIEAGDTENEAKASLRASFASTYKDAYKKAYLAGDNAECVRIRKLLKESGLYPNYIETYMSWQKEALQDKYKK